MTPPISDADRALKETERVIRRARDWRAVDLTYAEQVEWEQRQAKEWARSIAAASRPSPRPQPKSSALRNWLAASLSAALVVGALVGIVLLAAR